MRKKIRKYIIIFVLIMLGIIVVLFILRNQVIKNLQTVTESRLKVQALRLINDTVINSTLESEEVYQNLYTLKRDSNGKIISFESNAYNVNLLSHNINGILQEKISEFEDYKISLPLGTMLNLKMLYAIGPNIDVKILPISSSACEINSKFESAGINQTRHSVYVDFNVDMTVVIPTYKTKISVESSVLLYDIIIVGEIPDVYLD